mgnify:CR=1 FL=1
MEASPPTLTPPNGTSSDTPTDSTQSSSNNHIALSSSSNMIIKGEEELEFLFREEEFEEERFDAAAFVAKYRRVSSLESLREQLVAYSKHVKQHLYLIINRDYKDFITISTKVR